MPHGSERDLEKPLGKLAHGRAYRYVVWAGCWKKHQLFLEAEKGLVLFALLTGNVVRSHARNEL